MMLIYGGSSFVFLMTIESTFNGGFIFAVQSLWLSLALIVFGVAWWCRQSFKEIPGFHGAPLLIAAILYPLLLLFSWPHVMALNAVLPSRGEVIYEGPVVKKWTSGKKNRISYIIVVRDRATQKDMKLHAPKWQFEQLSVGDTMRKSFTLGGLGIPYRWRYGE